MSHETALIATLTAGFGLAFVFGLGAVRLRLPPLVGYLLAGMIVGPFTPGFVADSGLAGQLAEVGVMLLMFGVGLRFSFRELLAVRGLVVPGALLQIAISASIGATLAHLWGWSWSAGVVFGLCLSVSSTVVLLRALEDHRLLDSAGGRAAVGWVVVEDMAMVVTLVLLPAIAPVIGGSEGALQATPSPVEVITGVAFTLGKVVAFVALMLLVGRRAIPWLLGSVARTGSRELFTLGVLAIALTIAVGSSVLFGVSFALGAFFAGVVIGESDLSHQAAADALPLRDAFAVLFFVSVGMLFDPRVLHDAPFATLAVALVVMLGKSLDAFALVLLLRRPARTALTVAASIAQIGEFSFILAGLGISLGFLPAEARSLIVAAALVAITANPLLFAMADRTHRWLLERARLLDWLENRSSESAVAPSGGDDHLHQALEGHVIVVGHGRVGGAITAALASAGVPYLVIESDRKIVERLRSAGVATVFGDAARPGVLAAAHPEGARLLVVAAPDVYQARQIITLAREANSALTTIVRTHYEDERAFVENLGVGRVFLGEHELARSMADHALREYNRRVDGAEPLDRSELSSPM